ncbi:APC family permease [Peribacillus frigoritolerans]|uniref:APC family permease n=1 Tax=Peribacillus frigoritolerans TaxID=450367 RepID=UPI002415E42D|nr:APC family permease [Peribacillus frigoritolerans]MDG4847474.1 APC family permease [Peribacillus frigoritolerans]
MRTKATVTSGLIQEEPNFKRVLTLPSLVFYGLAYLIPTTIFDMYGIVSNITHGMFSLTHALTAIAILFTAFSYGSMVAAFPVSGSAYTYAQQAINPYIGFLTGWTVMMDYLLVPMLSYVIAANYMNAIFPEIPNWIWILGLTVLVTTISYVGINVTAKVNNIIVLVQLSIIAIVTIFLIKFISQGGGMGSFFSWDVFVNSSEFAKPEVGWGVIFTGASILVLSYFGFDAVTMVAEEAINPRVNVPRAVLIICAGAGLLFTTVSYFMLLAWPAGWSEFTDVNTGALELFKKIGLGIFAVIYPFFTLIGAIAGPLAAQTSCSRMLCKMGGDRIIPKFFGYIHPKKATPTNSILFIGSLSLTALFLDVKTVISLVNFGALFGCTFVNISVIFYYFIKQKKRKGINIVRYLLFPSIGALITLFFLYKLDMYAKTAGLIWLTVGVIYLGLNTNFFKKLPPELNMNEMKG